MKRVLTIGPDYRTLKGGIASVLEVYAQYDKTFKFLPTYSSENNIKNLLLFPYNYLSIVFFLIFNPSYTIVHIHGASRISFYRKYTLFLTLKYLFGKKVIYHVHGGEYHLFETESNFIVKKMIHQMIDESDVIICLSEKWKHFFENTFNPRKVVILNNVIAMPVERNVIKNNKMVTYLFLGMIVEGKGIFDLLKVISDNQNYFKDKIKIFIGGDGEVERLQREIAEKDIGSIVQYVGWVSGNKKETLLMASDVYVLPSYNEGLPISILEAMSYKMPIISTNVGGIPTIVQNHKNGLLIEAGDLSALFQSLKYFIEHKENIAVYGKYSFKIVQDFLPEKVIDDLHQIYRGLENESR